MAVVLSGCALLSGPSENGGALAARLAEMPLQDARVSAPVRIYWNDQLVPFVEADTDDDLAFGLGVVHGHLRMGQLEVFRLAARARLAEALGPPVTDVDHTLRILDIDKAVPAMKRSLPPDTRSWLESFVRGINHVQRLSKPPHETVVFGLGRIPFSVEDVLAIGRLAAVDVNWLSAIALLPLRQHPEWAAIWERVVETGTNGATSFRQEDLSSVLRGPGEQGSNAFVVGGQRTRSGRPLLANDPHLGLTVPNFWLIVGMRSPSYEAVGFMIPGVPAIAVGRNRDIAWGGTNMRAASSDLIRIPRGTPVSRRREVIKVRFLRDREVEVRDTSFGPVISDAPLVNWPENDLLVLRWIGHDPSDELTALLRVNRSQDFEQFRSSFESWAVSSQNFLYADRHGHIGQVMAARLPVRRGALWEDLVRPASEVAWVETRTTDSLPFVLDPEDGLLVSANNRPTNTDELGWSFSPDDRARRLRALLENERSLDLAVVRKVMLDTYSAHAVRIRDLVVPALDRLRVDPKIPGYDLIGVLRRWDGFYQADAEGPLAYELLYAALVERFFRESFLRGGRFEQELFDTFVALDTTRDLVAERLTACQREDGHCRSVLIEALEEAERRRGNLRRWGDAHRLVVQHPFARIPFVRSRYQVADLPANGGSQTILKTAHAPVRGRHESFFGAQARFVADLSHPDENYFVLLGGQDGWINAEQYADQVSLFRNGQLVRVPLQSETVRATFSRVTVLVP